jgi:TrmH family RNA methyltransferase
MIPRRITSLQHPLVKYLVKLRQDKDFREQEKAVLVSGTKLVSELSPVKILIADREFPGIDAEEIVIALPEIIKKITGLQNPEGVAAVVPLPHFADLSRSKKLVVLDGLSDPGNVGTLLRTALALGWDGAFLTTGSSDPFNEKAVRAAKGATFRLPLCLGSWDELSLLLSDRAVFVADAQGEPIKRGVQNKKIGLILGNEARGLSPQAKKTGNPVSIPMSPKMESLNVASAGAILMYALRD